ncbi:hypothetical protein K402DRAFT_457023 [Aulographum hederae CBS 113979]|uniref:Phosphoribosylaminoimidazole-succinocarboxamide synthase n=1 Tax=Aulographum hederae CBS 113979 TaxID=1176131 RepID=A0A6G1GPF7_9PEZI|nr:hypothetical protein K402DRAFT_457023 [Aulographum hederae CBS 113979]
MPPKSHIHDVRPITRDDLAGIIEDNKPASSSAAESQGQSTSQPQDAPQPKPQDAPQAQPSDKGKDKKANKDAKEEEALFNSNLEQESKGQLKLVARGKVRDVYAVDGERLLFVATDRISAFDVVMGNPVPQKGALLTAISTFWFTHLTTALPTLHHHLLSPTLPSSLSAHLPPSTLNTLAHRTMTVRRHRILPLESIVRGYLTGSAYSEYKKSGTVHGIAIRPGMRESEAFDQPIWTPSTKAEQGEHDENISPARAAEIVGEETAKRVEELSLRLYGVAREFAETRGIIIADTKFEFGIASSSSSDGEEEIVLVDEVLTPDSSRFWPREGYEVGRAQESFDKQFLRDWLVREGLKGVEGVVMPEEVVRGTGEKYREVYGMLTGKVWGSE